VRTSSNISTGKQPQKNTKTYVLSNKMEYIHHFQLLNKRKKKKKIEEKREREREREREKHPNLTCY
jgi:hypothetical protein